MYPLYFGNTNVFTFTSGGTVDLGLVATDTISGRATPTLTTVPTNVTPGPENTNIPQLVVPPTASISVTSPSNGAPVQGPDVPITFALQKFTIETKIRPISMCTWITTHSYEFLNGLQYCTDNTGPTAQWESGATIRFQSLSTNSHTVEFKLSTASHVEYVNPEASASVQFTVNPPPPSLSDDQRDESWG